MPTLRPDDPVERNACGARAEERFGPATSGCRIADRGVPGENPASEVEGLGAEIGRRISALLEDLENIANFERWTNAAPDRGRADGRNGLDP